MATTISLPKNIVERFKRQAELLGISLEEYLVELATRDLDPRSRVLEYVEAAKELLEEAGKELEKGNIRQAAEKVWGSTALVIKAYAEYRDGRRLTSHRELWLYKDKMIKELGEWIRNAWYAANSMHVCFYEDWCTREDVENVMRQVEELVRKVETKIKEKIA